MSFIKHTPIALQPNGLTTALERIATECRAPWVRPSVAADFMATHGKSCPSIYRAVDASGFEFVGDADELYQWVHQCSATATPACLRVPFIAITVEFQGHSKRNDALWRRLPPQLGLNTQPGNTLYVWCVQRGMSEADAHSAAVWLEQHGAGVNATVTDRIPMPCLGWDVAETLLDDGFDDGTEQVWTVGERIEPQPRTVLTVGGDTCATFDPARWFAVFDHALPPDVVERAAGVLHAVRAMPRPAHVDEWPDRGERHARQFVAAALRMFAGKTQRAELWQLYTQDLPPRQRLLPLEDDGTMPWGMSQRLATARTLNEALAPLASGCDMEGINHDG